MKEVAQPIECLEKHPNKRTTKLGGKFINQSAIARSQGIDQSYLSRIVKGERSPRLDHARLIAAAIGMTLEEFLEAIDEKKAELERNREAILAQHKARIDQEDREDQERIAQGKPPIPRMPATRAS